MPVALLVQKFGGSSVSDPERIRAVADHVARTVRRGNQVVVVVSAMGKTTDDLIRLANAVLTNDSGPVEKATKKGDVPIKGDNREMDMLLTAGERMSAALVAMAIDDLGVPAQSFTGSQAGIVTDTAHGRAKILEMRSDRLRDALARGFVPVVAGFQGVSTDKDITTLGRGGSDTTAVAVAAAVGADECEIYTDVTGVFTADPRIAPKAHRMKTVSSEEMLEMAGSGSGVVALRAVEFAATHGVTLHVRSSFTWEPGTIITKEDPSMEQAVVSGITHDTSEAKVTVVAVPDRPGVAARVFRSLADRRVNVDMIVQNTSQNGLTDISFTVPKSDLSTALEVCNPIAADIGAQSVISDSNIARVSIVGAGMRTNPGVSATMFETLANAGVNIEMISTSTIRLSCVIAGDQVETAVQALHTAFGLDV
jgi:aspartate kinase